MGTVYDVTARLHFKNNDPTKWCEKIRQYVEKMTRENRARFGKYSEEDFNDPWKCFLLLAPDHAHMAEQNEEFDIWTTGFDASYGWGLVCIEGFQYALPTLEPGSFAVVNSWEDGPMSIYLEEDGTISFDKEDLYNMLGIFLEDDID